MSNKTRRTVLGIAIIGLLVYVLLRIPDLIVNKTIIGEEGIGRMQGVSLSPDWLIALGLLVTLLILYRFQKTS